jgi:3-dehydroquinate synthase
MIELKLDHDRGSCQVRIGAGLLSQPVAWQPFLRGRPLIVTDCKVAALYLDRLATTLAEFEPGVLVLDAGETAKTAANWLAILEQLAASGAQRDATVIALGGGVIGDLAGFAAASYMRGIRMIQAPTTLLAQVDAAIGGKTGFNLSAGKNLVGAFHQPEAVLIDVATLTTLPEREYLAGLAEVIKYGAIGDAAFLDWLAEHRAALQRRDEVVLQQAVARSVEHKIRVVEADEREAGRRALLNFGHSFGHAIETCTGYARFLHGEAVAIGMALAAALSARLGMIEAGDAARLVDLIAAFGLPTGKPDDLPAAVLLECMRLDKKNLAGRFRLVLLNALGDACIRDDVESETLMELLTR